MAFKFIVETFLGYKRPGVDLTHEFMDYRIAHFKKYTLNSLKNQEFKEFDILVQTCAEWYPLILGELKNEKVFVVIDNGKLFYREIISPYLIITRIDSDDMFHKNAMKNVYEKVVNHRFYLKGKRLVLAFKNNICWDILNGAIIPHRRNSTPFFTHVFPIGIYSNWKEFCIQHFCSHGDGGAGDRTAKELNKGMVCVIKHGQNWSLMKRGLSPFKLTDEQIKILKETGSSDYGLYAYEGAIWDTEKQAGILENFGVKFE